ncbi:recombinase family protein [Alkalihalobacillus trypoxylicola]|uniref:Resolvase n=1 Tax=Alkalihalobacillus trypoxylicola TaxID=519424 RepID=A0A162F6S3_9BACI|nr:recombinase family protein [Alkalihalobacillus trypoxylicola]KYG34919.1 resolvase [Alkalihalobacillus trypoxylicola]
MKNQVIAYARVSTQDQHLDRQLDALQKHGYDILIKEKYTGTKREREGLNELMDRVQKGDTVIVESISRIGRKTLDILSIVDELQQKGVIFNSLKEKMDTSTPTGQAMFKMMCVIAELERDMIAERVKEGLQSAKNRGKKLGRPKLDNDKVNVALRMYDSSEYSIKEIVEQVGISQGKLYKEINKRKLEQ